MPLKDSTVRAAAPGPKPYRLSDGDGLYVIVRPSGAKWWRFQYRHHGIRKGLSMGTFPKVSVLEARAKKHEAQKLIAAGTDPSRARLLANAAARVDASRTFAIVANDWFKRVRPHYAPKSQKKARYFLDAYLIPQFGPEPIGALEPPTILAWLRTFEDRGRFETAHRAKYITGQVCQHALLMGWLTRNPVSDLRRALRPVPVVNRAALVSTGDIAGLLRAIDGYRGSALTTHALQLLALTFVRPGELREAQWAEFDLPHAIWRIPAARMKSRRMHTVPLSTQAQAVLVQLKPLVPGSRFLFPSLLSRGRAMSDNTINAALRRMGFTKEEMTAHGFRALASTRLNEMGFDPDVVEAQLAHAKRDVRAVYHRAEYLPERTAMMSAWADELDRLRRTG